MEVALDFLMVLVLLSPYRYSVLLVLALLADDLLQYVVCFYGILQMVLLLYTISVLTTVV